MADRRERGQGCRRVALPCECGDAETPAIARDEFVMALPKGHRLAARARVPAAALAGERMLLLEDGHCLRDQALALCGVVGEQEGFAGPACTPWRRWWPAGWA